ncbi:MAG TPA: DinB family protein [Usitatibacter sp.]|nr:DinB family protein [Usitatibacter sp.]
MDPTGVTRLGLTSAIEQLQAMPAFVEASLAGVSAERLRARPGRDEFSLLEQACHLRDLEREGYLVRVRRMLGEERPALASFDGAAVARERDYLSQDAGIAAQEFSAARRELTGLLAPLTQDDMRREATFEGRPICLADLLGMIVEHDRGHRAEIEALRGRGEAG